MHHITAIGFDLFNTLIILKPDTLKTAMGSMIQSLQDDGIPLKNDNFIKTYEEATLWYIEESRKDGRETHNRYWISKALDALGYTILPDDPRINKAVDAYFSHFSHGCRLIPGTKDMLEVLKPKYRLGLLTNFTHPPAVRKIIDDLGLIPLFEGVIISGEIGYRKPHPIVFRNLIDLLGVKKHQILYVGDDPEPDIIGARNAGLQPVWTTCVQEQKIPVERGLFSRDGDRPNFQVPRISAWGELLSLLNHDLT